MVVSVAFKRNPQRLSPTVVKIAITWILSDASSVKIANSAETVHSTLRLYTS